MGRRFMELALVTHLVSLSGPLYYDIYVVLIVETLMNCYYEQLLGFLLMLI